MYLHLALVLVPGQHGVHGEGAEGDGDPPSPGHHHQVLHGVGIGIDWISNFYHMFPEISLNYIKWTLIDGESSWTKKSSDLFFIVENRN